MLLYFERFGVIFPSWRALGWETLGTRTDRIGERDVVTVHYAKGLASVGYSAVSGDPLDAPGGWRPVRGTRLQHREDRKMAAFDCGAHTCVVSGVGVSEETLVSLARRDGKG